MPHVIYVHTRFCTVIKYILIRMNTIILFLVWTSEYYRMTRCRRSGGYRGDFGGFSPTPKNLIDPPPLIVLISLLHLLHTIVENCSKPLWTNLSIFFSSYQAPLPPPYDVTKYPPVCRRLKNSPCSLKSRYWTTQPTEQRVYEN